MCDYITHNLDVPEFIEECMASVERHAVWTCDTIRRESYGMPVKAPTSEFISGEGDDRMKGYKWQYISKFATKDYPGAKARAVLGQVVGLLYTAAGMSIEPQNRTGRVGHEQLIDVSGRVEFVSRIFVPVSNTVMHTFPKLRKTFYAAAITFNMEAPFHEACAVKMLSLISVAYQCPLQSQLFALLFRYHQYRATLDTISIQRRRLEWWEYKLLLYASDHKLGESRLAVYEHFMREASDSNYPAAEQAKLQHLSCEMQRDVSDIKRLIDLIRDTDGKEQEGVAEIVGRYAALLPPV